MKINHSFQINSLLKMISPPPHFLENYFAEVKIRNDHMIDTMEDRVKHGVNQSLPIVVGPVRTVNSG